MGYKVKWIENNLDLSRKSLSFFEEKGLMPKTKMVNIVITIIMTLI